MHASPNRRFRRWGRVSRAARAVAVVTGVMASFAAVGTIHRSAVAPARADGVELAPGISAVPAPGWTIGDQGRGWVRFENAFSTAELEILVKHANRTDPAAVLQSDINNRSDASTTGLVNVRDMSAPTVSPVRGGNFQQEASINYSADGTSVMGTVPVTGWFMEMVNPSTHQSAFIVFVQNEDAPNRTDGEATAIVDSML